MMLYLFMFKDGEDTKVEWRTFPPSKNEYPNLDEKSITIIKTQHFLEPANEIGTIFPEEAGKIEIIQDHRFVYEIIAYSKSGSVLQRVTFEYKYFRGIGKQLWRETYYDGQNNVVKQLIHDYKKERRLQNGRIRILIKETVTRSK